MVYDYRVSALVKVTMHRRFFARDVAETRLAKFVDPIAIGKDNIGVSFYQMTNFLGKDQVKLGVVSWVPLRDSKQATVNVPRDLKVKMLFEGF
jgi:hypothetical protein